ncbi:MAG: ligase-associated DNA damage response endonuclease PdeM [Alphaproteobacteria bacterium]|nr:ligase-associated DNA damage response endonuclease PdeM [Alphaproteobacteria bacterium]
MRCVSTDDLNIEVNGEILVLDRSGAAWWPGQETLVFADIHFEKGSSYAMRGALLPPYDTRTTLRRMGDVVARRRPKRIVALGDSFHDRQAADRLDAEERAALSALGRAADWVWITGNHDPAPPAWLGGTVVDEIKLGRLVFRHEPGAMFQPGEIAGHLHPVTTVTRRGRSLRRRCFVSDGRRMVLPAFGAYAGGLDLWETAIRALFDGDFAAFMLGTSRVYAVSGAAVLQTLRRTAAS